jgi:hypothetical protein
VARVKAGNMVNEARTWAETMLHDARARAETLERQSQGKAQVARAGCNAQAHTDILGALSQEKCLLEKNIDELRAFAQEHHIRITACMRTSFRCWTSRIRHPSNPIHTQQA